MESVGKRGVKRGRGAENVFIIIICDIFHLNAHFIPIRRGEAKLLQGRRRSRRLLYFNAYENVQINNHTKGQGRGKKGEEEQEQE